MRLAFALAAIALMLAGAPASGARGVWIDTDPAIGSPLRDVDDGFALVLAFHSPELRIAGISTTYGNASLRTTDRVARDLVERFGGPSLVTPNRVYRGARSAGELRKVSAATDALASTLRKESSITYVALGPLTNLATFLALHPQLAKRIDEVVFVGGKSPDSTLKFGPLQIHDANVVKDPAAAAAVIRSKLAVRLVPPETSSRLMLGPRDLREIGAGGPAGAYLLRNSRVWLWFWTHLARQEGGPLFDALAIAALRPGLAEWETRYATVDRSGNLMAARQTTDQSRRVKFCTGFTPATKAFVLRRLAARR